MARCLAAPRARYYFASRATRLKRDPLDAEFMDIDTLISVASDNSLRPSEIEQTAQELGCTIHELCDRFAKELAKRYLDEQIAWEPADAAINKLYAIAYGSADFGLGEFAWSVYLAFDEGEYIHAGGDPEPDGEPRTRKILSSLIAGT